MKVIVVVEIVVERDVSSFLLWRKYKNKKEKKGLCCRKLICCNQSSGRQVGRQREILYKKEKKEPVQSKKMERVSRRKGEKVRVIVYSSSGSGVWLTLC